MVVVTPLGTRYIGLKERRNCSVRVRNSFSHSLPVRNDVSSFSYSIILFHLSNLIIMFVISLKIWPICITLLYNNPSKVTSTCMGHLYFFIHTRTLDCWFDFLVIKEISLKLFYVDFSRTCKYTLLFRKKKIFYLRR